jgi:hypothetical protein
VCLGDRASQPRVRPSAHRALTVTHTSAVVESKSRFDRAEPSRSCTRDTTAGRNSLIHNPAVLASCFGAAGVHDQFGKRKNGGRMRLMAALLVIFITSSTNESKASDDTVTVEEMLANPQNEHNRTYLRGVWEAFSLANVTLEENHQKPLFCPPPKLEIPLEQVVNILKQHMGPDDHSLSRNALAGLPVEHLLLDALQDV